LPPARLPGSSGSSRSCGCRRGVSYCATCDASFFRDKVVTVVGGGDSALEEALFISRFASKVYLVHRREEFRASPIMVDRAKANEKIELVLNKIVEEVLGDTKVTGVRLRDTVTGESRSSRRTAFVAIGHDPNTGLFSTSWTTSPTAATRDEGQDDRDEHPRRLAAGDVQTTSTGRPSPQPAPAARPRSTPSGT
jgi:thioredoxin reductase (NADPH)